MSRPQKHVCTESAVLNELSSHSFYSDINVFTFFENMDKGSLHV